MEAVPGTKVLPSEVESVMEWLPLEELHLVVTVDQVGPD